MQLPFIRVGFGSSLSICSQQLWWCTVVLPTTEYIFASFPSPISGRNKGDHTVSHFLCFLCARQFDQFSLFAIWRLKMFAVGCAFCPHFILQFRQIKVLSYQTSQIMDYAFGNRNWTHTQKKIGVFSEINEGNSNENWTCYINIWTNKKWNCVV